MKKTKTHHTTANNRDTMQPEYDFSQAVRGKHSARFRQGYSVEITQEDGSVQVQRFMRDANAVVIDQDVRTYFPDAASINKALRALIEILPKQPGAGTRKRLTV